MTANTLNSWIKPGMKFPPINPPTQQVMYYQIINHNQTEELGTLERPECYNDENTFVWCVTLNLMLTLRYILSLTWTSSSIHTLQVSGLQDHHCQFTSGGDVTQWEADLPQVFFLHHTVKMINTEIIVFNEEMRLEVIRAHLNIWWTHILKNVQ